MHHNSANPIDLFQLIPPHVLEDLGSKWRVDKNVRRFSTAQQLEALILRSLFYLSSFREIEATLHVAKSTFADACRKRSCGFFEELCSAMIAELIRQCPKRKVRKALRHLLAIDSTELRLHGSLIHLPGWREGRSQLAGAKLHVVWNVSDEVIEDFRTTNAVVADLPLAKKFPLKKGVIYVFDRAYTDIAFWLNILKTGSDFVARLKKTPRHNAVVRKALAEHPEKGGVLFDGEWTPSEAACYRQKFKPKTVMLRQIIYRDPVEKKVYHFITSDLKVEATEIAEMYRQRWSVELLFRWLKGHLAQFRSPPVRSPNAVRVYIATAVLTQLLLQLKRILNTSKATLTETLRELRARVLSKILCLQAFQRFKFAEPAGGGPPNG